MPNIREKLIELFDQHGCEVLEKSAYSQEAFERLVDALIANGVMVQQFGYWIKVADLCGVEVLKCSVCGKEHPRLPTTYCCDCGAKMDKGSENIG